ncbi:MAG: hypothetical protein E7166_06215 [Firmicutes bacterium]|nr:hypothetical protein [Bacillota bacterium]
MRGSKGGFWDRLLSRFRLRRLKKIREEKKIIQKNLDNLKNKEIKKNEEIYLNRVFSLKSKKRTVKLYKKGIASKIKTTPKINSNKAIKDNKKTINKVIKFNQKRIKKKVGITSKKIEKQVSVNQDTIKDKEINNNNVILEFKTEKLISELNKIVNNNREMINSITYQINELKSEIDEAKSIKKINEIENKLIEIKRKLDELVKNYSNIKNTNLKQLNNEKITQLMEEIKKISPEFNFEYIIDKISPNLDYYNELSNNVVNSVTMLYSADYQKDVINYKNIKSENVNDKLGDFSEINNRLSAELEKHKNIVKNFNLLINKISPKKIIHVQNNFISTMLYNTGCLLSTFLSIPFLKKPKNIPLFTFGLFTINNSIRSMRKITTTESISYIASEDYTNQILKYKNSFGFVDYMIDDSLYQISNLKEEYIINFSSFHNSEEFEKNLRLINEMEQKIIKQSKDIKKMKQNYENALNKNYEKVLSIKNKK